jgi:hypothetical protein
MEISVQCANDFKWPPPSPCKEARQVSHGCEDRSRAAGWLLTRLRGPQRVPACWSSIPAPAPTPAPSPTPSPHFTFAHKVPPLHLHHRSAHSVAGQTHIEELVERVHLAGCGCGLSDEGSVCRRRGLPEPTRLPIHVHIPISLSSIRPRAHVPPIGREICNVIGPADEPEALLEARGQHSPRWWVKRCAGGKERCVKVPAGRCRMG